MTSSPFSAQSFAFNSSSFSTNLLRSNTQKTIGVHCVRSGSRNQVSHHQFRRCHIAAVVSTNATGRSVGSEGKFHRSSESITTMKKFWELADESKLNAQYHADDKIAFLQNASADEVRNVCLQYRYFVERYPDNLAGLLRKMPNNKLKSELAMILAEELGSGKIDGAHIVWYDRFLRSIGVKEEQLADSVYDENEEILREIERRCDTEPCAHIIGLVGMGGECLCQIYLTVMYKYLMQNDFIQSLGNNVDWVFWKFHVGEEDVAHREMVRKTINEIIHDPVDVQDLAEGYTYGKNSWDLFWENNYKETKVALTN